MTARRWNNEAELAALIKARAKAGLEVRLSADTAYFVALKLEVVSKKPTFEELARAFCERTNCEAVCYRCNGKANALANAYGFSLPRRKVDPDAKR